MTILDQTPRIDGALKFAQLPDNLGATWRTEVAVGNCDAGYGHGVDLGSGYGALYTRTSAGAQTVYWRRTDNPDDWSGATETDSGLTGQVRGLARNEAGVLMALIGKRCAVSRDMGASWAWCAADPAIGGMDAGITSLGGAFMVVEKTDTDPRFWVTLDSGGAWL